MEREDVIGAFRSSRLPLPTQLVSRSPTKVHNIGDGNGIAHVYNAGNASGPVLNSTTALQHKDIRSNHHLFLYNESIWVQHHGKHQREFVETYFDKTFSQFNLNQNGNAFLPEIKSLKDLSNNTDREVFFQKLKAKKFVSVSIFDLEYDETSNVNLVDYLVTPGFTLRDLVKEIVTETNSHIVLALFSRKYDGTNIELIRHHVNQFWADEPRVNFIFPTSPYSTEFLFSFEFGTLAEVLKNMTGNPDICAEIITNAQDEIASRWGEIQNHPNREHTSVCGSSFVYFTRAKIKFSNPNLEQTTDVESSQVRILPVIPALGDLAKQNLTGFDKRACESVEEIMKRMCFKSLNFLNVLAHNPNFEDRDVLFAIALSMFDYLSERNEPLTNEQIEKLQKLYFGGQEAPFPEPLFRYMSRPPDRSKVALSKIFQTFHVTSKWEIAPQKYTKRTLHYIKVIRQEESVSYRTMRNLFSRLFKQAKDIKDNDEFRNCFGFEINVGQACYPHGILLFDPNFTDITKKLVHRFHVVHNQELDHISVNGHSPRADLWIGSNYNYFMTANHVNEGLSNFEAYFDSVFHRTPFGDCDSMIQLDHEQEPRWLRANWEYKITEEEE